MYKTFGYVLTWLALLALLAANIALAFIDLGRFQTVARLAIPLAQALLIVTLFMYRRGDSTTLKLVSAAGFLGFFLLFALTFNDYYARPLDVAIGRVSYTGVGFQAPNK